jgi:hypothetical protein
MVPSIVTPKGTKSSPHLGTAGDTAQPLNESPRIRGRAVIVDAGYNEGNVGDVSFDEVRDWARLIRYRAASVL